MLDAVKRWLRRVTPAGTWQDICEWAREQGYGWKRARADEGFVIDGEFEGRPWRLEWGPPQRAYIQDRELRIRMELGLPGNVQMLLIARPLMDALESETFARYTETTQTLIDVDTPEEMRWLAMFPKVDLPGGRELRQHFGAVASDPAFLVTWTEGALAARLERAGRTFLAHRPPFVLMTLRGRAYLRLQLAEPDRATVEQAVGLFDIAVQAALRVASMPRETLRDPTAPDSTAWHTHLVAEDPPAAPDRGTRRR